MCIASGDVSRVLSSSPETSSRLKSRVTFFRALAPAFGRSWCRHQMRAMAWQIRSSLVSSLGHLRRSKTWSSAETTPMPYIRDALMNSTRRIWLRL